MQKLVGTPSHPAPSTHCSCIEMVPGRQMEHHKQQLTVGSCKPEPKKDLWNSEQPARWPRDEYHVLRGKVWLSADYLEETIIDACLAPFFWAVDFRFLASGGKPICATSCRDLSIQGFQHDILQAMPPQLTKSRWQTDKNFRVCLKETSLQQSCIHIHYQFPDHLEAKDLWKGQQADWGRKKIVASILSSVPCVCISHIYLSCTCIPLLLRASYIKSKTTSFQEGVAPEY